MEQATASEDRLARVLSALDAGWPERSTPLREFASRLLSRASADFFQAASVEELAAEITLLFELLEATKPDEISVRVRQLESPRRAVLESVMPDCAFIVNTLRESAHHRGLETPHLLHPVLAARRDEGGKVVRVEERRADAPRTSTVYMLLAGPLDDSAREAMEREVAGRLENVRLVNEDFEAMLARASEAIGDLEQAKQVVPERTVELHETQDLLRWLQDGNFVFLGARTYDLSPVQEGEQWIELRRGTGLGILRDETRSSFRTKQRLSGLAPELQARVLGGPLLIISKTNSPSPVHRLDRMDYLGIKRIGADGEVVGEHRFLGLFTAKAYNQDASEIPILRRKLREILKAQGAVKGSHDYRLIFDFFGSMPPEELFLGTAGELSALVAELMETEGARDVRLTARPDALGRGANVMVVLPKQRFSGEARLRIQDALVTAYGGTLLNYHLALGESDQARLHFYIASEPDTVATIDMDALGDEVRSSVRSWDEHLADALREAHGADSAARIAERHVFTPEYRAAVSPDHAVADLECLERLLSTGRPQLVFEPLADPRPDALVLKVFASKGMLVLSDALPVLENFGFRVLQAEKFDVGAPESDVLHTMHRFEVEVPAEWEFDMEAAQPTVERTVWALIDGDAENDALNSLVLSAGLEWREVALLRAYAGYAFRCGAVGSRTGVREPLVLHPELARLLVSLFHSRFDPASSDREEMKRLFRRFRRELALVSSIEHDRTFRRLLALLGATLRTNYFQTGSRPAGSIALKFDCSKLDFLPRPRPRIEVYVSSPSTEGAHLRMDAVARGGIRWSDRHEDFRVEVLGLVKTQQVKNALIVPAGAKGAFIVKRPPSSGPADPQAAVESYREFIAALLDLADNIRNGEIVHPADTIRLDGDDPYLVVAADKGTATLSDTANALAEERGFWLGDAFASGGSRGYDHKALGITAKGAWECVRRHFRELGKDIQSEPFTVAGIGDMSGDVFGNGMLLSRQIRLIAAFDHRHVFIDPDPDPETSWEERKRLFDTPGCNWADYDARLLSRGGGVYERGAKRIDLEPEARRALGLHEEGGAVGALNGEELVRAVLKAPAELLWNGGIGTYVKHSHETHAEVGDPLNDGVRVDASQLKARVIGEGGNLGLTQRARVEYALRGGRVNTDAIDNSGGVDLSDHEVNLKILLDRAVEDGALDRERRHRLLADVAGDVVEQVLHNSRSQSLALSLDERRASDSPAEFHDAQLRLERLGTLDSHLEFLPDADAYAERVEKAAYLTRPELAVLLAYAKMHLKEEIRRSSLPEESALLELGRECFPSRLAVLAAPEARVDDWIAAHPLRSRLIATELTNRFVDSMGSTALLRLTRETGRPAWEVARAWFAARNITDSRMLQQHISAAENDVAADVIRDGHLVVAAALERCVLWILANCDPSWSSSEIIDWLGEPLRELRVALPDILPREQLADLEARQSAHESAGLPGELARQIAATDSLDQLLPASRLARDTAMSAPVAGAVYFRVSEQIDYRWLREQLSRLAGTDMWAQRAAKTMRLELEHAVTAMSCGVLDRLGQAVGGDPELVKGDDIERALEEYLKQHEPRLARIHHALQEVRAMDVPTLPALMVIVHTIRSSGDVGSEGA